jgi:hypothetical protein
MAAVRTSGLRRWAIPLSTRMPQQCLEYIDDSFYVPSIHTRGCFLAGFSSSPEVSSPTPAPGPRTALVIWIEVAPVPEPLAIMGPSIKVPSAVYLHYGARIRSEESIAIRASVLSHRVIPLLNLTRVLGGSRGAKSAYRRG